MVFLFNHCSVYRRFDVKPIPSGSTPSLVEGYLFNVLVSYEQVTKVDGVKNDADKKDEVQSGRSFVVQAKPGSL